MKVTSVCVLLFAAVVAVPIYVNWLRHRPHRLEIGTQHIVLIGSLVQIALIAVAVGLMVFWFRLPTP